MPAQHKKTKEPVKKRVHPYLKVEAIEEKPASVVEKIIPEVKTEIIENPDNSKNLHITSEIDITIPAKVTLSKEEAPKILEPIKLNNDFQLESPKEENNLETVMPEISQTISEENLDKENIDNVKSSQKPSGLIYFIIIFFLSIVVGGLFFYVYGVKQHKFDNAAKISASPTPASNAASLTLTPTPSKLSREELGKYNIKILNGTDTAGLALKLKNSLTTDGFNVSDTGNADNSNYQKTVIEAKSGVKKVFLSALQATLNKSYTLDSVKNLAESETADIIVIIGSQTAQ